MRLRGGFFLFLLSLLLAGTAAGASGKLQGVRTVVDPQGTTFFLRLPTPVEYTPSQVGPKLFLVDLAGVSTDRSSDSQPVESPLVSSYRFFSYQGADNRPHLGMEITLKQEANVRPVEVPEGLQIQVQNASAQPERAPILSQKSLREVSVIQPEGSSGLEVEILADGALTYRTLQLKNPDRLVVDIPNTINRIRQKHLEVNTPPLRAVRIGQFRLQPPIARVVMDLEAQVPFQVRPQANGLIISLSDSPSQAAAPEVPGVPSLVAEPLSAQESQGSPATPLAGSAEPVADQAPDSKAAESETGNEASAAEVSSHPPEAVSQQEKLVLMASNTPVGVVSSLPSPSAPAAWKPTPAVPEAGLPAVTPEILAQPVPVSSPAEPLAAAPTKVNALGTPAGTVPQSARTGAPKAATPEARAAEPPGTALLAQRAAAPVMIAQAMPQAAQQPLPAYTGEPISLDLKDVDLKDFFRLMHEVSGLNIVLDPTVSGMVTIVLDEVPWDQAMDLVLKNNALGKEVVGNVVRIAKLATLEGEEKQRMSLTLAVEQAQPRETSTRTLSYAKAADLLATLKRFLSARGELVADARTNTLIITDIPAAIAQVDRLIGSLDRKTQQVEIEARIVAASRSFARDIGSQLAASGLSGNVTLGGTGLVGESPIKRGIVPPLFIGTPPEPSKPGEPPKFANLAQPLAVNLPVAATSGLTFLLTSGANFALDAIITAAESRGVGKLLSRPKIITQNNVQASVKQGSRIPLQTTINNTVSVQYIDVVLRMTVTPQITAEGTIFLTTDIENTSIDPGIATTPGQFGLTTQAATTQVLVSDGGTVFFGGVIANINRLEESQVPLLGSVPLIGNLFKRKSTTSTTNELLFFITPKIVQS